VAHGQGQQSRPTSLKLANRLDLGRSAGWPPTVDLLLKQRPPAADEESAKNSGGDCVSGRTSLS
jgi:hypothetical protein